MAGFLGGLGKILGSFIPGVSAVAGLIGQNQSQNRQQRNTQATDQNRLLASLFNTQQGAQTGQYGINQGAQTSALQSQANQAQSNVTNDLNRRQFALNAPSTRGHQAVTGSILQSLQPLKLSGGSSKLQKATPMISGGLSAANLGPGAREAGRLMESGALEGLRNGDKFDALPTTDFQSGVLKPPELLQPPSFSSLEQPGKAETLLGLLGLANPLLQTFKDKNKPNNDPRDVNGNDGRSGGF